MKKNEYLQFLNKYDSIEEMFDRLYIKPLYGVEEEISDEEYKEAQKMMKVVHNIDSDVEQNQNYDKLALDSFSGLDYKTLYLYSSKAIDEIIETELKEKEKIAITLRYGLKDGEKKTIKEVADVIGISRTGVDILITKALRKIRNYYTMEKTFFNTKTIDEVNLDKDTLIEQFKKVFINDTNEEEKKSANEIIRFIVLDECGYFKLSEYSKDNKLTGDLEHDSKICIEYFIRDSRIYKFLKRAGINNLGDLLKWDNLKTVRNLGNKSIDKIKDILHTYGYKLKEELAVEPEEVDEDFEIIYDYEDEVSAEPVVETVVDKSTENKKTGILTGDIRYDSDLSIHYLELGTKIETILNRYSVRTIGELLKTDSLILINFRGIGHGSYNQIKSKVNSVGYNLKNELTFNIKPRVIEDRSLYREPDEALVESTRKSTKEIEERIKEKREKSKLLDEYIRLAEIYNNLKKVESNLDKEIKEKEEILRKKGFTHEKK